MNQTVKNILTACKVWLLLNWWKSLLLLLIGFGAGAVFAQTPTVSLTATIGPGNVPTLTWSAPWASSCTATGGWTGAKANAGTQTLAAIAASTTYGLDCAAVSDTKATLTWTAPTQNTDGSALTNLAAFNVFHGTSATVVGPLLTTINSPTTLTYVHTGLAVGPHCYALTAVNAVGAESAKSGILCKPIVAASAASGSVTIQIPKGPILTTVETTVYDVRFTRHGYLVGRAVGEAPIGTLCREDFVLAGDLYRVSRRAVQFTFRPRSAVVVAKCA
jgi:hypothetical protein